MRYSSIYAKPTHARGRTTSPVFNFNYTYLLSYLVDERKRKAEAFGDHMMLPKSNKVEEGGFLVARWVAALVVLALFVVLVAAERVYVYEVESDFEITEDVPHVPGISWRFGEQLLVVWVPRDVAPGVILFTNETVSIPLYDRKYFLLVVPADARPSHRAEAEALLKTPDGAYPVVFRKPDGGIIDILAHSIEEALNILKQLGLQPEYRGKAELIAKKDPLDAGKENLANVAETTLVWAVIGVLVALLAVVAGHVLRRR
jgi:hypothetical protein